MGLAAIVYCSISISISINISIKISISISISIIITFDISISINISIILRGRTGYWVLPYSTPGKVANPARGQLNRENEYFPVPVRAGGIWSRETGSAVPSRVIQSVGTYVRYSRRTIGCFGPNRGKQRGTPFIPETYQYNTEYTTDNTASFFLVQHQYSIIFLIRHGNSESCYSFQGDPHRKQSWSQPRSGSRYTKTRARPVTL